MSIAVALWGVAALLGIAVLGVPAQRISAGSRLIYLGCLLASLAILIAAGAQLLTAGGSVERLQLPIGLPWIGAHFAIDALSAFFLGQSLRAWIWRA
jgi:hydrogenase-4 component B